MAVRNLKIALNYPNGGTISSEVVEKLRIKTWQTPNVGRLPVGYTEVEYIESTGVQYIDTEINGEVEVILDAQGIDSPDVSNVVIGSYSSVGNFFGCMGASKKWGINKNYLYDDYNERITADISFSATSLRVSVGAQTHTATASLVDYNYALFKCMGKAGNNYYYAKARIFHCIMSKNNEVIRNFIPCINPDGSVGMYDLVSQTFFENKGTGTFLAGDVVSKCISDEEITKFKIGTDLVFGEEEPQIHWIDLGLPSGTLWADRNVGASTPNDYGGYYAWGELEEKEEYSVDNYSFPIPISPEELTELGVMEENKLIQTYDVAHKKFGGYCGMPDNIQLEELMNNTSVVYTDNVAIVTSNLNGNSITIPLAGMKYGTKHSYAGSRAYYWVSYKTPNVTNELSRILRIISPTDHVVATTLNMNYGISVRAVNNDYCVKWVDMGNNSILFGDRFLGTDPTHPYGRYYAWGEITDKEEYTTDNYQFQSKALTELKDEAVVNSSRVLNRAYDVAYQVLKANVAIPQISHIQWLYNNTTKEVSEDGMYVILTSTINGNVIQLPLAGTYQDDTLVNVGRYGRIWTKSLYNQEELKAYIMTLNNSTTMFGYTSTTTLYQGFSILPIKSK